MPIQIQAPDGSLIEFPDGTDDATIKSVMAKSFGAPQKPAVAPEIAKAADAYEKVRGTGAMAAATDAGATGIPFSDELYSAVSALPNAAISAIEGKGFHPVDEYNRSQALQAELDRRRRERHPIASAAGSIAGGMGATAPVASAGYSLLNGAKATLPSLLARGAGEGAIYGGVYGAGEGNGLQDRAFNALKGAAAGAVTGAGVGALGRIGAGSVQEAAPSIDELRAAGQAAYDQADKAGVIFTPKAVDRLKSQVMQKLTDLGYDPALQPGAAALVRRLDDLQGQNITLKGLDSLRKVASNGFIPGNKSNNKAIGDIIDTIDGLVTSPGTAEVMTGDAAAGADALAKARDIWARASKAERVSNAVNRAELRAASTGSGGNVDNAIRQNLRRILESPRGFSEAEKSALEKAVTGTRTQNALRLAGKLSPSGNGLMAALGIGGTMVNPALGAASLGGMGAKTIADAMTKGNVGVLDALIRNGGKLPTQQLTPIRQAILQALIRGGGQQLPGYISQ